FSLFTASCLKNLGIPYGYRFASYSSEATPTHVYVYVPLKNGGEIILDSVWKGPFNTEKTFTHKRDYLMSEVHYLGATTMPAQQQRKVYNAFLNTGTAMVAGRITAPIYRPAPGIDPTVLKINVPMEQLSEGELDLLLARQRLEIEKRNSIAIAGPENYQVKKYNAAIGTIDYCISKIDNPDAIIALGEAMIQKGDNAVIGGFFKKIGRALKKGFKAIGKGVQKAANAVAKVVTFPLRLIAKGIMEIYLPKAAPAFLYLFAPEASLPDKMKRKRKKAEKFKRFVTKKIGMKEKHFMAIVRNALTKKYKKSPESFLAEAIKNSAIKGIGSPYFHARVNLQRIGDIPEHFNFSPEAIGPLLQKSKGGKKFLKTANTVLSIS
ncbi:MAG TPA: hypothetical protein PLN30_00490, partial [Ferruginibacter sp.]|nr:hypothetical protein [Ferruginibacter sp.]